MDMPIRRFWLFSDSIDRMNSAADMRAINVAAAVLGKEAYSETMEKLSESLGTIVVTDYEKDSDGIDNLKQMMLMK